MTTTAHEDQFTDAPEPVRQTYSIVDILRQNVADLEIALRKQTERAESAEAELAKLREQEPVAWDCGGSITANSGYAEWFSRKDHGAAVPLYTNPIPAPAVPEDWREAAQQLIDAAGDKTCSSLRCNYPMDCCSHELIVAMDAMSALLQSAEV